MVLLILNVVAPVLLCVLVGFAPAKFKLSFDTKVVGMLVANVCYPSLVLSRLAKEHVPLAGFIEMMAGGHGSSRPLWSNRLFAFLAVMRLPPRAFLTPPMLLTLGHTLATLHLGVLWRGGYLALFHLAMAVGVAFALVTLFAFEDTARGVLILQCLMPVSVTTYLRIERYTPDHAAAVASFILVSTLPTIVALPLVLTSWVWAEVPRFFHHRKSPLGL